MISKRQRFFLADLLASAREAAALIEGLDDESLRGDRLRWLAVERLMITVGETVAQLEQPLLDQLGGMPWALARGMRNILVHRYWEVQQPIVADTIRADLPGLIAAVERFLAENPEP